jgi:hypothetical protein
METLNELAVRMPTEESYQLVTEHIANGGGRDNEGLSKLAVRMPTEESYQAVKRFMEGAA